MLMRALAVHGLPSAALGVKVISHPGSMGRIARE